MPRSVHSQEVRERLHLRGSDSVAPESEKEIKKKNKIKKSRAAGAITSMFARTVDVNVTRLLAEIYGILSLCGSLNQPALWEVESSKAA